MNTKRKPGRVQKIAAPNLTHVGANGEVRMVDVSAKAVSVREAVAQGRIRLRPETVALIARDGIAKGNVLATARIAGIQAAKETPRLIPLCHSLDLTHIEIAFETAPDGIDIRCAARATARTGAEMEALTGVTVAALAIYDMCKAVDDQMEIGAVHLMRKSKRALVE